MPAYEYRTVAAPRRAPKAPGAKGPEARVAHAMGEVIRAEAVQGWEYLRVDSLPIEEGGGLFSKPATVWRAVLVFRREIAASRREAPVAPFVVAPAPSEPREPFMSVAASSGLADDAPPPGLPGARRD